MTLAREAALSAEELAGCASAPVGVGIDVERIDARLLDVLARFATPSEVCDVLASRDPSAAATGLWAAKEAVVKATGGAVVRRRSIAITTGAVPGAFTATIEDGRATVRGCVVTDGEHVLAWVTWLP